ncbi:MAG TPA: hypothetical protein VKK79_16230 [Candidatus Lokiarchaeia archaeon]|nr:hypothetical protein [Candidatus Lokiarchaeia archaeon]
MSYIPKYIIKRLVAEDGLKKVEGGVELTLTNVIQPLPADQIPGNPLDFLHIKINDNEMSREDMEKVKINWEDREFTFESLRDAGTIPIGAQIKFTLPTEEFDIGQEVTIDINIPDLNVNINFARKIAE